MYSPQQSKFLRVFLNCWVYLHSAIHVHFSPDALSWILHESWRRASRRGVQPNYRKSCSSRPRIKTMGLWLLQKQGSVEHLGSFLSLWWLLQLELTLQLWHWLILSRSLRSRLFLLSSAWCVVWNLSEARVFDWRVWSIRYWISQSL